MTEFGRLLRYAVPGGILELLVGLWLVLDAAGLPRAASDVPSSRVVAAFLAALHFPLGYVVAVTTLLIAAAFPLGYLISVIANEIAWFLQWCCPETRVWGRIGTERVLGIAETDGLGSDKPDPDWLAAVRENMNADQRDQEAFAEVVLRMAHGGEAYQAAVDRVRALADHMNSLINSFVAVALAWLVCTGFYGLTMKLSRDSADDSLWLLVYLVVVVAAIIVFGGRAARCRITRVARSLLAWTGIFLLFAVLAREAVDDPWRLLTYLAFGVAAFALLCLISMAEQRVARITEAFVIGMILGRWRTND